MRGVLRSWWCLVAAGCLVAALPAAATADDCPNADVRVQQGSGHLADCRGYELVSPPENSNGGVIFGQRAADDGSAVTFTMNTATGPEDGAYAVAPFVSRRSEAGWDPRAASPPIRSEHRGSGEVRAFLRDATEDFGKVYLATNDLIDPDDLEPIVDSTVGVGGTGWDIYRFDPFDREAEWLSRPRQAQSAGFLSGSTQQLTTYIGSTPDGSHVVFHATRPLTPDGPPAGTSGLYEWANGELRYVGILPDGTSVPGATQSSFPTNFNGTNWERGAGVISEDGSRVFWRTAGGALYVREDGTRTLPVSISHRTGTAGTVINGTSSLAMTPDGGTVYFQSPTPLTDEAPATGGGLYRWDRDGETLTFVTQVTTLWTLTTDSVQPRVSDSGDRLYFHARSVHAPGAVLNARNLYLIDDGTLKLVATTPSSAPGFDPRLRTTDDGRFALFTSRNLVDPSFAAVHAAGVNAIYLYDAETGETRCVSCRADGQPGTAEALLRPSLSRYSLLVNANLVQPRNISADGSRVYFHTAEQLVPEDTNGALDVYEWQDGVHRLISNGKGEGSELIDSSADGSSVFFMTTERLSGIDADGGYADVYVARVGGGFPEPAAPDPACQGDDCQGSPTTPPAGLATGSESFAGFGDLPILRAGASAMSIRRPGAIRGAAGTLRVRVSAAGRIRLSGARVRSAGRPASRAATYRVKVRLKPTAKRQLAKRGKLTVRMRVVFRSRAGHATSKRLTVTFKAQGKGGRR